VGRMGRAEGNGFDAAPPAPGERSSLTGRAVSGLRWSYLGYGALLVANLAYTATISRLLDPVAFGLMALANLVVLFAQYFVRMGLASALVQKPALSGDDVRAASTAGLALGVACYAVVWALTPAISALFRAPDLTPVLRLLGVSFLFEGFSMTGMGLLRRQLRFRELSVITVGTYVLGFLIVGVGLALLGAGVWSLVVGALVSGASQSLWQYALLRHPVRPVLRWQPYREVCGYGMRLSGAHLLDYAGSNLDNLVVGRVAGTAALGQYSRAYYLAFQPLRWYLTQALTQVLFPHLSRIQDDPPRLRRASASVLALAALVVFPVCAGMAVAAAQLVRVVLGPQWDLAASLIPWFALAGGCSVISALAQTVAEARAELNRSLAVQVAYLVVLGALLAGAVALRSRGLWVFAAAVTVGEVLRQVGYVGLMRRAAGLSAVQLWKAYAPAALASAGVAVAVAAVRWALAGLAPAPVVLAAEIAAGALGLALCVRLGPLPAIRRELGMRLEEAGVLGRAGGLRRRLAQLVLGRPGAVTGPEARP
jgi:lipopolysaccharide exporter